MTAFPIKHPSSAVLLFLVAMIGVGCGKLSAQSLPGTLPGSLSGNTSSLFNRSGFLPVDEAFSFYTAVPTTGTVTLHWSIAPEYYLYRDKFAVTLSPASEPDTQHPLSLELPPGVAHHDEFFGDVDVFYDRLEFQVRIPEAVANQAFTLTIHYQGCAELGLCYPEQRREVQMQP